MRSLSVSFPVTLSRTSHRSGLNSSGSGNTMKGGFAISIQLPKTIAKVGSPAGSRWMLLKGVRVCLSDRQWSADDLFAHQWFPTMILPLGNTYSPYWTSSNRECWKPACYQRLHREMQAAREREPGLVSTHRLSSQGATGKSLEHRPSAAVNRARQQRSALNGSSSASST
jgi:hypothetical protein